MATYRTPNVYVEEIRSFPPSVAEVETAIPAFVGFTEKASRTDPDDLLEIPTRIKSLKEYEHYFGGSREDEIKVSVFDTDTSFRAEVKAPELKYILHYCMRAYFDNGGGPCYVVSVGNYASPMATASLEKGLNAVRKEDEPTLLVIPEATRLGEDKFTEINDKMLKQCGELKDRFAILDTHAKDGNKWADVRKRVGAENLKYGAIYHPHLRTSYNFHVADDEAEGNAFGKNVLVKHPASNNASVEVKLSTLRSTKTALYNFVRARLEEHYVEIPPSAAVAGVYAKTDRERGVWKAPANVGLGSVVEPVVRLDDEDQGEMNVDPTGGKSINAIRAFMGKGNLVWGARTLAGNDNEWRYVSVRRFFNMVEESVKKSTYWAVFEPNDANTWAKVRGMIENFLTQKWREGALAGATPKEAFFVRCGLGTTMDSQDILEGRMNVEIGMAAVRPAEFIILKFSHKLQTS